MRTLSESVADGVCERLFALEVGGEQIPGVLWFPERATGSRPLVLMGHGGTQHKRVETLVARARGYVTALGFAVAAIDAPDHGDRSTPERAAAFVAEIQRRLAEGRRAGGELAQAMADRARKAAPEWRATLDALQALDVVGDDRPVGYWGVSMGTAIGVPFVASDPRVRAAVFGLAGLVEGNQVLADAAARIDIPVEFVLQADDEIVDRADGIALYDAFRSGEKSLHLNPGGHLGLPAFERASWERFFVRHLT